MVGMINELAWKMSLRVCRIPWKVSALMMAINPFKAGGQGFYEDVKGTVLPNWPRERARELRSERRQEAGLRRG